MKRIIITFSLTVFAIISVMAQTVLFSYDESGNRDNRYRLKVEKVTQADSATIANEETKALADEPIVGLRVYPNPANTVVNIEFATIPETQIEYVLSDINGKLVDEGHILKTLTTLNLQRIGKGIYILVVKEGPKIEEFKIIKQ